MLSLGREFFPEWRNARRRENARGTSRPIGLPKSLNRNEVRILARMARGHTSKEIAERIGLAKGTVNNYRTSIKVKLGVRFDSRGDPPGRAQEWTARFPGR